MFNPRQHIQFAIALVVIVGIIAWPHFPQKNIPVPPKTVTSQLFVPIFVYHVVRPIYPLDSRTVRRFAVTPDLFDQEMAFIVQNNYHTISFTQLEDAILNGSSLPPRSVIISFDDGWEDQYVYAFPILEKYHLQATFFVTTDYIGHRGFLTWPQLQTFVASGMSVESHSQSHPLLTRIKDQKTLDTEITGSKIILENKLNIPITEFAYPYGSYNTTTIDAVKAAGYRSARGYYYGTQHSINDLYAFGTVGDASMEIFKGNLTSK